MDKGDTQYRSATAFYKKFRAKMDKGVKVVDDGLYDADVELSAIQHAHNLKLQAPDAFEAEYQNNPVSRQFTLYEIDSKLVRSRCNGLKRHECDKSIKLIVSFCDINFSGLHWTIVGFRNDRTGFVLDYGKIPERGVLIRENANEVEIKNKIYKGLNSYTTMLNSLRLRLPIRAVGIDRGFKPETVHNFCTYNKSKFALFPSKGYAGTQYRPGKNIVGKQGVECHINGSQYGQYFAANSCYFREIMQRGFLSKPGQAGSLSFYGKDGSRHRAIADHACAERLTDKAEGRVGTFWKWASQPGADWDWGDALTGSFALATWYLGELSLESTVGGRGKTKKKRKRKQRKSKVQIED